MHYVYVMRLAYFVLIFWWTFSSYAVVDGGDLFEFVRNSRNQLQKMNKDAVDDYRALGERDVHCIQANKVKQELKATRDNELTIWTNQAKAALGETNPKAQDYLTRLELLTVRGRELLGNKKKNEQIGKELQLAGTLAVSTNGHFQHRLIRRTQLAEQSKDLVRQLTAFAETPIDELAILAEDESLDELGSFSFSNQTEIKRFYEALRKRRLQTEEIRKIQIQYDLAVEELDAELATVENSPFFEDALESIMERHQLLKTNAINQINDILEQ